MASTRGPATKEPTTSRRLRFGWTQTGRARRISELGGDVEGAVEVADLIDEAELTGAAARIHLAGGDLLDSVLIDVTPLGDGIKELVVELVDQGLLLLALLVGGLAEHAAHVLESVRLRDRDAQADAPEGVVEEGAYGDDADGADQGARYGDDARGGTAEEVGAGGADAADEGNDGLAPSESADREVEVIGGGGGAAGGVYVEDDGAEALVLGEGAEESSVLGGLDAGADRALELYDGDLLAASGAGA